MSPPASGSTRSATRPTGCIASAGVPDKKHLAAGGVDKSIRVWAADKEGGKLVHSVFAHEKPVWRLGYADAGATLFSVGEDRIVKSWDAANMTEKKVFDRSARRDPRFRHRARRQATRRRPLRWRRSAARRRHRQDHRPATPAEAGAAQGREARHPPAFRSGKSTTVTVTGTNLDFTTGVTAIAPDVTVKIANSTADTRRR